MAVLAGFHASKATKIAYITNVYFDYQKVEEQGFKDVVTPNGGSVKVFNSNFDPQVASELSEQAHRSLLQVAGQAGPDGREGDGRRRWR